MHQPEKPPDGPELTVRTKATAEGCSEKKPIAYQFSSSSHALQHLIVIAYPMGKCYYTMGVQHPET